MACLGQGLLQHLVFQGVPFTDLILHTGQLIDASAQQQVDDFRYLVQVIESEADRAFEVCTAPLLGLLLTIVALVVLFRAQVEAAGADLTAVDARFLQCLNQCRHA